tara:strand:- start:2739 stop:3188 length:450 start_codon:yes stop_codon:yes gene_type:complete
MAGKIDKFEYDFGRLVFNGVAITNVAATAGTTSWWIGLMTADPTETGSTAAEGGYTAYTRVQMDRSTQGTSPFGWAVSSGTVMSASPTGNINFPQVATTSTGTFTHFMLFPSSAAQASSGLYFGTVTPNINFSQNVTPQLTTSSSITED